MDIPRGKLASLGAGRKIDAIPRFNDDIDRVTLPRGKPGCYKFAFTVERLRTAGVDAGATITFTPESGTRSRESGLPDEMLRAFAVRPELAECWAVHSMAIRRQVVRHIFQAKTFEAQTKRSGTFLEGLALDGSLQNPLN